ncbi:MAG TPA: class D sortase [Vicinamibacterales bacterium]
MLNDQPPPSDSGRGAARRWIAGLLVLAGAAMLLWSATLVIEARLSQETASRSLELAWRSRASLPSHDEIGTLNLRSPTTIVRGSPLAELLIPRVRLSSIVLHGSDAATLRRGPGHLEHTPLPGESGNVAIAGHRDTFFRQLRDVKVGDDVYLHTPHEDLHYRIAWARVVAARDVSVLEPTEDDVLTLVTCYPFWVVGPAPDRFVVRATRIEGRREPAPLESRPVSRVAFTGVAPLEPRSISRPAVANASASLGDDALIRLAIERFRVTYNAWLINHNGREAGLLQLSTCDVAITGDAAEATCEASFGDARVRHLRTLTLERAGGTWVIRSTTD